MQGYSDACNVPSQHREVITTSNMAPSGNSNNNNHMIKQSNRINNNVIEKNDEDDPMGCNLGTHISTQRSSDNKSNN